MLLTVVFIGLVVLTVLEFIVQNWGWKGEWRYPFLRDLVSTIRHFDEFHDYAARMLKALKTDHVMWKLGFYDVLVITNPEDVKHMLKDNWKNYAIAKGLRGDALQDLLGDGILRADGQHWYVQRKHASREFSAHIFKTFMTSEFSQHAKKLSNLIEGSVGAPRIDLHGLLFRLTLDAFGKIAFGLSLGGLDNKPIPFAEAFDRAQELSAHRIAQKLPFVWKLQRLLCVGEEREMKQCCDVITSFVHQLISERKSAPELASKEDLLSKLMTASEVDSEVEPHLREAYLRDITVNFIIAGRDTTACAMSWFFYEIATHPDIEKKLVQELDLVLEGKDVTFEALQDCQYLTACLSETLRLHPSVPFNPKTAMEDDTFPCGARISKGGSVAYLPYAMGRMASIWGSDAEAFRPERWLNAQQQFVREDACKFSAFQAGPRLCLGVDMAMLEMKVVVGTLLPKFHFALLEEPVYRVGMVLQMKHGLQVKVSRR